jgi:hypothetical protein
MPNPNQFPLVNIRGVEATAESIGYASDCPRELRPRFLVPPSIGGIESVTTINSIVTTATRVHVCVFTGVLCGGERRWDSFEPAVWTVPTARSVITPMGLTKDIAQAYV